MPISKESLQRRLEKALGRYEPKAVDMNDEVIPLADEADAFRFNFVKDGENYGKVYITLDDTNSLTVWFDDTIMDSPSAPTPGVDYDDTFTGFLKFIKRWAMNNQLSFKTDNRQHLGNEMARRKRMKEKENISEGYHAMGRKASYNDAIPNVKIVLQHNRVMEEGEQRFRNIEKIFVENQNGERFLVPTTKPGLARVFARHIAEGGTPYDERATHIQSLVEEYNKMAGFVRATRNGQFNESAHQLVQEGINHYLSLRESLGKLTGHKGYTAYFESWTPTLMEDEADVTAINELFVQETLDPRIESVMPILSRLHKQVAEMKEVDELSEWADNLLAEKMIMGADTDASSGGTVNAYIEEDEGLQSQNPVGIPEGRLDGLPDEDGPVVNAITRRILMQRVDLLSKYGPEKVAQAITDVADFVGDVEEIGSSDVSGWVKRVEQELGGSQLEESHMSEVDMIIQDVINGELDAYDIMNHPKTPEEEYVANILNDQYEEVARDHRLHPDDDFEQILDIVVDNLAKDYGHPEDPNQIEEEKPGLWANIHAKRERIKHGSGEKMRKPGSKGAPTAQNFRDAAKESVGEGNEILSPDTYELIDDYIAKIEPDADREEIAQSIIKGYIHPSELEYALQPDLDEGILDTIKKGAKAVGKAIVGKDDDELLADLKKRAGVHNPQTGKPSMAHSDVQKREELDEIDVDALNQLASHAVSTLGHGGAGLAAAAGGAGIGGAIAGAGKKAIDWYQNRKEKKALEKQKGVAEDLDANQKRVGQLGPTEKVKNNNIGKLVGANESFINTDAQAVVTEMDSEGYKGTRDDDSKGPEAKAKPVKAKDAVKDAKKALDKAMDKAHKKDVKEGQEDLDAILRIIRK